ncbi:MAG: class I SAM-dependent RNA methyltransferase [Pseudomonadota bacterium]
MRDTAMECHQPRSAGHGQGGELIELVIEALGAEGDGEARHGEETVFVPFTLAGERVLARRIGKRHALALEWRARASARAAPPCPFFGACGGCALQHLDDGAYQAWKSERATRALARRGLRGYRLAPLLRTPPGGRRRAEFAAHRRGSKLAVGFHARLSHEVVPIGPCPILDPALVGLLPALHEALFDLLDDGGRADILATKTASGLDLVFTGLPPPDRRRREAVAAFAAAADLARIAWRAAPTKRPEIIVQARAPQAAFGGIRVDLPPGAFLQPSEAAERAIVAAVRQATGACARVADLYAGCGTIALALAHQAPVHALDIDADMVGAMLAGARRAGLAPRLTVEARNLSRRPLRAEELEPFDAVVFDPPREGAAAQARELARAAVSVVVGVSCDPGTFARDARQLIDGGYRLIEVQPIDQFLWSPHLELVGVFRR